MSSATARETETTATGRGARLVLVGAGGLGSAAMFAIARATHGSDGREGHGRIARVTVIDGDRVEAGNLHRQLLHRSDGIGVPKARSAAATIAGWMPGVEVFSVEERLHAGNAAALLLGADLVLDGSDNFATKFLVNDACVIAGLPFVHAAAVRWGGQLLAVDPRRSGPEHPCYRCLFEAPPLVEGESCAEAGVVGPVVGVVGALQGEAALALLDGREAGGTLLVYDGRSGAHRTVRFHKNPECVACGPRARRTLDPQAYPEAFEARAC